MAETTLRALLDVTGIDRPLRVLRLEGREALSELYAPDVELSSDDAAVDLDAAIGQAARLTLQDGDEVRYLHGLVASLEQAETVASGTSYRAVLVPGAWMLDQGSDSRVLSGLDVSGILGRVFERLRGVEQRFALSRTYATREICVQYRESDWAFASRLMEDEGIFYAFEHAESASTLVLSDTRPDDAAVDRDPLPFMPESGGMRTVAGIQTFTFTRRLRPGKVTARDVSFANGYVDERVATRDRDDLERYEPGILRAEDRLDALHVPRAAARGTSSSLRLVPGGTFTLAGHPRASFNVSYLVTAVVHRFGRDAKGVPHYACDFECIPAEQTFRPDRRTPRPRILGPQSATVVGPEGLELHSDEAGRVLVHLDWDRSGGGLETACWVPVAHMASGTGFGAMSVPRIGSAVLVEFVDGDPDRPIATGRVYNQLNPHPYALPAHLSRSAWRTQSTPGGEGYSELRFEDRAGSEEVYLRSQRDLLVEVLNDALRRVGRDETVELVRDRRATVGGTDSLSVAGAQRTWIGAAETHEVVGSQRVAIGVDHAMGVGGAHDVRVGGALSEEVAGTRTRSVTLGETLAIGGDRAVTVGGDSTSTIAGTDTQTVAGARVVSVGGGAQHMIDGQLSAAVAQLQVAVEAESWVFHGGEMKLESMTAAKIGAPTVYLSGETLRLRAYERIVLEVGDSESDNRSRIEITTDGVFVTNGSSTKELTGDVVYLNC